jgi:valyl-tRNA synthetase
MDKNYQPKEVEQKWYKLWEDSGYFKPEIHPDGEPFTIILPPPNANADLHVGHAMYVVEDIMIRYNRMKGKAALWVPGADHAGFETQFVYEKHLSKEGKSRFDFPRDVLFQNIWEFVHKNRGSMENQLRRLGFSLDWSRQVFTLDPKVLSIVYKTFQKLYEEGLVYRDLRLVNYCTKDGTGFSDLEVATKETEGILYHIKFPVKEGGSIIIATTRPETYLGDVAVMVNPKDKRYKQMIGKTVLLPIIDREIPVIADEYVDMEFGTGAVKVTPAHDFNDYEIARKHHLTYPPVIGFDGRMQHTGMVDGMKVKAAREEVVKQLTEKGFLEKTEPHLMVQKTCYKCGTVLEPLPLPQWYVKIRPLADAGIEAIKQNTISFTPKRMESHAIQWLTDFHDWNISRQNVWGIRIPVWYSVKENPALEITFLDKNGTKQRGQIQELIKTFSLDDIRSGLQEMKAPIEATYTISTESPGEDFIRETDTFDTWFSSGQWPFATLLSDTNEIKDGKFIDNNPTSDFNKFYPTSVMETGYDILPWWVCRMIMFGLHMTTNVPFKMVYLHGLVRDGKGQKMSKSKGNVINPLVMCDQYGTDALRMSLIFGAAAGNDLSLSEDKIRGMRNFSNKLWNIGRFIQMNEDTYKNAGKDILAFDPKADRKILHDEEKQYLTKLGLLTLTVTQDIENNRLDAAANALYEWIWHEFADWYIEASKERLKEFNPYTVSVMKYIYLQVLTLLHPFMPFITEEIVNQLEKTHEPLIISQWPK